MILKDKSIAFLGDSITEGCGVKDWDNNRFDNVMKKTSELKAVYNYGIGGTRIAYQLKPSEFGVCDLYFIGRAYKICSDCDIIVVFGGTNDYGHGDAPFGELTDKTAVTYCGAVDLLMTTLKNCFPDKTIVFMTPARREGDLMPGNDPFKNADAKPLKNYVDVIKTKGIEHNIPVLDLYENLGINPNNPDEKEKYAEDGLHFNDEGHKIIAEVLTDFIEKL